ncbi:M23 family metallopeptidase [Marinoscillum pacificum]|uniref:M23 family metallopeptidase n=1 Tax=Marinoscillum pacificum TaxID=392723 RepID=UPI0021580EDA|nr:M23 family metallopeptidase [Marinoscillum pacificum]
MRYLFLTVYIFSFTSFLNAQSSDNYYLFPIRPGEQNYLAGTMGELRSSHFHAGIDIKTGGQSGWPVYAAADGYINRIRISNGGYGHALYIAHTNGTSTVYGHLSKFNDDIAAYVLDEQYEQQSFTLQLFPNKEQFKVKKGDIIAYSGNTGSSTGPHLHFEIRDKNQRILDPLSFNFPEIKDQIAPQVKSLAFVTLDGQSRVNGMYGRYEFDVLKTGSSYEPRIPIELSGNIGIEIYAYDLLNGVYNRNGIPETTLIIDGDTIFREVKNSLSFAHQKSILVHMDYERYKEGGPKFNKLFIDDGNDNDFYDVASNGFIFNDELPHDIKILLEDSYGNISVVEASVNKRNVVNKPDPAISDYEIYRNHLHLKNINSKGTEPIKVFHGGSTETIVPYRETHKANYALYDLRKGIPDSIAINGRHIYPDLYSMLTPGSDITFYNHDFELALRKKTLFDTLYLRYSKSIDESTGQELFDFPLQNVPFKSSFTLTLKPTKTYADSTARVYAKYGKRLSFVGGEWEDGMITFDGSSFGTYTIAEDLTPPVITPRIVNSKSLYFKITDDLSGIRHYRATLNGEFLLMSYEYKDDLIWATPRNQNNSLVGEFILEVTDNTGNKSVYHNNLK